MRLSTYVRTLLAAIPRPLVLGGAGLACALAALPALAHEFWIEAEDYTIESGQALEADLKVGQLFKGDRFAFNPRRQTRFDIVTPEGAMPVSSRIGDRPAVNQAVEGDGLAVLVHQTTDFTLSYTDPAKFEQFVAEEGLDGTLEAHAARGLPDKGFTEIYSRHVKALVDVGEPGGGADRALGLPIELVVEINPYDEPLAPEIVVQALYEGEPMRDALVNVFAMHDGREEAARMRLRTDEDGRVRLPMDGEPGQRYLLNVVKMREPSAEKAERTGAVWESLWASTTFSTEG